MDDDDVKTVGAWTHSVHSKHYIGKRYIHDANKGKGDKTLSFSAKLPGDGEYEVRFAYSHGRGRATNVPVTVISAAGEQTVIVDMSKAPPLAGRFLSLGTYRFEADGQRLILVSNAGTNGVVTADAVQFLRVDNESTGTTSPASQAEQELTPRERQTLTKRWQKPQWSWLHLGNEHPPARWSIQLSKKLIRRT